MRLWTLAILLLACGGGGAGGTNPGPTSAGTSAGTSTSTPSGTSTSTSTLSGSTLTLAWAPENGKLDKVGDNDGALKPDGKPDNACVVEVQGPASAIFIAAVTDGGEPTGDFQADTKTGDEKLPIELSLIGAKGKESRGLGVMENDKLVNAPNGSVDIGPGSHKLTLFFSKHEAVKEGLRVFVLMKDGSLTKSSILK